uniref:Late blight resistance protein, putative n=1 Tax=Solanum demissum TaxID=50514 RepID=Q0KIR8_SOLDE|nr:Late blight resistance protein, putative [Solanum demissum]
MLGQTPQHPSKTKLREQNNRVLRKAMRLTTDSRVLNWINGVLNADPGYLHLYHKTMQANWHQYIDCTSMRAGQLNNNLSLKRAQKRTYLGSVQLMNN